MTTVQRNKVKALDATIMMMKVGFPDVLLKLAGICVGKATSSLTTTLNFFFDVICGKPVSCA